MNPPSKVEVDLDFNNSCPDQLYLQATSSKSCQDNWNVTSKSTNIIYICKKTKTAVSGIKAKYTEQEYFVIKDIATE